MRPLLSRLEEHGGRTQERRDTHRPSWVRSSWLLGEEGSEGFSACIYFCSELMWTKEGER